MGKTKGIILALVSSGTFGLIPFFAIPMMEAGVHTSSILFYRTFFSAIILFLFCILRGRSLRINFALAKQLFVMGILYALTAFGMIHAFHYISSGIVTTIHFLYPILVAILMSMLYRERLSKRLIMACVVSIVGVGFLCWQGDGFVNMKGVATVLFAVLTYAFYIVKFNRKELQGVSPEVLMFWVVIFGLITVGVYTHCTEGIKLLPNASAWYNAIGLTLFATVLSGLTLIKAVQLSGSTITSILGSMESVVATIIGVIHFHEPFGLNSLIGFALIIFAVSMVIMSTHKKSSNDMIMST